jgi:hypothetical protein
MDYSTLHPLLFFAVFLVSQSIGSRAFRKLTLVQQQAAKEEQSILWWVMVPLFVWLVLSVSFADKIISSAWIFALCVLGFVVPTLFFFTWMNLRLRAKQLPSSYLKSLITSQAVLLGGCLLVLFWR